MTGTFTLTIRAEGEAFTGAGEPNLELARLMRVTMQRLLAGDKYGKLLDVNGVICGSFALAEPEYRWRLVHDMDGTDPGDWLPQDREHYDRVGPFTDDGGETQLTWDEWSSRPDSQLSNWASYVLFLDRKDPGQESWVENVQALGGMDYYIGPSFEGDTYDSDPGEDTWYALHELPDDHLREVAKDLLSEEAGE